MTRRCCFSVNKEGKHKTNGYWRAEFSNNFDVSTLPISSPNQWPVTKGFFRVLFVLSSFISIKLTFIKSILWKVNHSKLGCSVEPLRYSAKMPIFKKLKTFFAWSNNHNISCFFERSVDTFIISVLRWVDWLANFWKWTSNVDCLNLM